MGYDVHITRAHEWPRSAEHPISPDEWLAYIRSDSEIRLDNAAETSVAGQRVRIDAPGLAVWMAYSGHNKNGNMAWFLYDSGRVVVKNPDEEIISKMVRIAASLDAHVEGDDGERYSADGTPE